METAGRPRSSTLDPNQLSRDIPSPPSPNLIKRSTSPALVKRTSWSTTVQKDRARANSHISHTHREKIMFQEGPPSLNGSTTNLNEIRNEELNFREHRIRILQEMYEEKSMIKIQDRNDVPEKISSRRKSESKEEEEEGSLRSEVKRVVQEAKRFIVDYETAINAVIVLPFVATAFYIAFIEQSPLVRGLF